jgi:DNA-binding transcriptional ArsR family regulator
MTGTSTARLRAQVAAALSEGKRDEEAQLAHSPREDGESRTQPLRFEWEQALRRDPYLVMGEKGMALLVATWADLDGGSCFPSIETLARSAGYRQRSVRKIIARLRDAGWLRIEPRSGKSNGYRLTIPKRRP